MKDVPGIAEPQLGTAGIAEPQLGKGKSDDSGVREQVAEQGLGVPGKNSPKGWYSRGYLPHCDHPGRLQSITYHLADSLPADALTRIEMKVRLMDPQRRKVERRKHLEAWLDAGYGCCVLRDSQAAACIIGTWRRFAGERYDLIAWVVMPNHVHVLVRVYDGVALGKIIQSWKSYTGRRIGPLMRSWDRRWDRRAPARHALDPGAPDQHALDPGAPDQHAQECPAGAERSQESRAGTRRSQDVWFREYWDRFIRDQRHFDTVVNYIHGNPVKAGLVKRPEDWPWSSDREYRNAEQGLGGPGD